MPDDDVRLPSQGIGSLRAAFDAQVSWRTYYYYYSAKQGKNESCFPLEVSRLTEAVVDSFKRFSHSAPPSPEQAAVGPGLEQKQCIFY